MSEQTKEEQKKIFDSFMDKDLTLEAEVIDICFPNGKMKRQFLMLSNFQKKIILARAISKIRPDIVNLDETTYSIED